MACESESAEQTVLADGTQGTELVYSRRYQHKSCLCYPGSQATSLLS